MAPTRHQTLADLGLLDEVVFGDCLEQMQAIPDASVDLILADLPYGATQNKWDSVIPLEPLWDAYLRVAKPNAAIVLTSAQPFTSVLVTSQLRPCVRTC